MLKLDMEGEFLIDTCGTGGDGGKTFNISTAVAIIAAAAGVKVAKHGNRAVSSKSGSADVLEALGIKTDLSPEESIKQLKEYNMSFLFAQQYHKAMKNVGKERKELGTRTIFNLIGPLANPAPIRGQLMGIFDGDLAIIEECKTANNGEIVVALIENEATIKRFYKEKNNIRLQPENDNMEAIIVDDCKILGKLVGLFRTY